MPRGLNIYILRRDEFGSWILLQTGTILAPRKIGDTHEIEIVCCSSLAICRNFSCAGKGRPNITDPGTNDSHHQRGFRRASTAPRIGAGALSVRPTAFGIPGTL